MHNNLEYFQYRRFMTFSSHIAMIYKSSALQDILVKLLFIEYRLSQKIPLIWESDEWVHFNKQWIASTISDLLQRGQSLSTLGIFQSPSQPFFQMSRTRYVTSKKTAARETRYPLVAPRFNRQQVARNLHFGYCHSFLNVLY